MMANNFVFTVQQARHRVFLGGRTRVSGFLARAVWGLPGVFLLVGGCSAPFSGRQALFFGHRALFSGCRGLFFGGHAPVTACCAFVAGRRQARQKGSNKDQKARVGVFRVLYNILDAPCLG